MDPDLRIELILGLRTRPERFDLRVNGRGEMELVYNLGRRTEKAIGVPTFMAMSLLDAIKVNH